MGSEKAENSDDEERRERREKGCLYDEGDRVLVPEGNLFYEAKVIAAEMDKGRWKYLVHYQGWNKKWDEWLTASKLMRDTTEAREAEKEKLREAKESMKKSSSSSRQRDRDRERESRDKSSSGSHKKKEKRKRDRGEEEGANGKVPKLHIALPSSLKKQLIDNWEQVTKGNNVVPLPRTPTVHALLQQFLANGGQERKGMAEIVYGIQAYFDKALPNILLYPQERSQCDKMLSEGKQASEVYGAEHLLRLFIKLPDLLPYKNMDSPSRVLELEKDLADIITYLQKNEASLFTEKFEKQKS